MFGSPVLLKQKVVDLAADVLNPSPITLLLPPLTPSCKWPCHDHLVLDQIGELVRMGVQCLDSLHDSQMAALEVSGVMVAAILWQQGVMQDLAAWEMEVRDAM